MAFRSATVRPAGAMLLAALIWVAALFAVPQLASAGTYDVWSCATPSGEPTSTEGWTPVSTLLYDEPGDDCALGGRLSTKFTALGGAVSGGLASGWQFTAPQGTKVKAAQLQWSVATRAASDDKDAVARVQAYRGTDPSAAGARLLTCDSAGAEGCPQASKTGADLKPDSDGFGFSAGCAGPAGGSLCTPADGARAVAHLEAARITLDDAALPTGKVTGQLVEGEDPWRGRGQLRVSAADVGSGVWQAEVRIGPTIVAKRRTLDSDGGRCAPLRGTRAFGSPQPCPAKASGTLPFSTKEAPDGSQLMTVTVWDAANNPSVIMSKQVYVDNAKRVKADGTILMPAIGSTAEQQLFSGGGNGSDKYRPPSVGSDPALMAIVGAMNTLADAKIPYCYGGGHGTTPAVPSAGSYCWIGSPARKLVGSGAVGLDCSSSLSWVLQQAGYSIETMTSGNFARLGEAGPGKLFTIWANAGHVYAEVVIDGKSYYWGTSRENSEHGPGWHSPRSSAPFTARHLPGL